METLKRDAPARYETVRNGLVCVRVTSIAGQSGRCTSDQQVTMRVTRTSGAYRTGETITSSALHVIPTRAVWRKRYKTLILPYLVECDQESSR